MLSPLVTTALSDDLIAKVVSSHPVPIADAMAALAAADNPFEQRDRVVETFRACLRWLAGTALAARLQYGGGPGPQSPQLHEMLRSLRSRGLTDGQWLSLLRELLRPWAQTVDAHPLPALVTLFHKKKARLPKVIDELLVMRKAETVAHGATGSRRELGAILAKRLPQLGELLELTDALWERARVVRPLDDHTAQLLMGATPAAGRFRRVQLSQPAPRGELLLLDGAVPRLALHPLFVVEAPNPGAMEELFTLDRGGKRGAVFVAFPSMAERTLPNVWDALAELFGAEEPTAATGATEGRPFRGLASFGPEHASVFFGREEQAETLANRIRRVGMLTLTGPSGAGKTSLLQAGTLPRIRELASVVVRPGRAPLRALGAALGALPDAAPTDAAPADAAASDPPRWLAALLAEATPDRAKWLEAIACAITERRVVLVIDQAEELLTLCKEPEERSAFGGLLAALAEAGAARVVLSVRDDFFARLGAIDGLRDLYNREVEVVATPDRDALARTVLAPLEAFGFALEDPELLVAMVEAVEHEPAALALLSFSADRLWELRDRRWKRLTWEAYHAIGGVAGALASHADGVLERMTPAQRGAARRVLLRLVTPERTRAVVARSALVEAGADQGAAVVGRLTEERLLAVREATGDDAELELVHEALIGHWSSLRAWLGADEEGQRLSHALGRAAREWAERGETRALLWRDEVLEDLLRWRRRADPVLTEVEARFATASEREERRRRLLRRGLAGAALVTAVVTSAVLFVLWRDAVDARNRAEIRGLVAQAREREPRGEVAEAAALYRAASALDTSLGSVDVSSEVLRLGLGHVLGRELPGHRGPVWRVAFSPSGELVATASVDGTLRLWDVATGTPRHELAGHAAIVEAALFTADGARVVTASGSLTEPRGEVFVWDVKSGKRVRSLAGHTAPVLRLAEGPGWLASASRDKTVRLWHADTGELLHVLAHDAPITDLAACGGRVVSGSGSEARVWDAATGALLHVLGGHGDGVLRLSVSDEAAALLIVGATRGTTRVWDLKRGLLRLELAHPSEAVAAAPDGTTVATAHGDGVVRLFRLAEGDAGVELVLHREAVSALAFGADGSQLVSAAGSEVAVWSVADAVLENRYAGHREVVHDVALSGSLLATGAADRSLRLFEAHRRPRFATRRAEPVAVSHAAGAGRLLFVFGNGALVVRDGEVETATALRGGATGGWLDRDTFLVSDERGLHAFDAAGAPRGSFAALRGARASFGAGRFALLDETSRRVVVGDLEGSCSLSALEGLDTPRTRVALSPAGDRVVVAHGRSAQLFGADCTAGPALAGHEAEVAAVSWSPSGRWVATTSRHTARLWDAESGASMHILTGHQRTVTAASVSTDEKLVATASLDGKLRLFELAHGQLVATLDGGAEPTRWAVWSPDGRRLASAGDGPDVLVWDVAQGKLIERLSLGGGRTAALSFVGIELGVAAAGGAMGLFATPEPEPADALRAIGVRSNVRVCRHDQTPVPVLPFPEPSSPWAPAAACATRGR